MHICGDEIIMLVSTVPFLGAGYYWLKEKCGLGCKHAPNVHDCETCEPDHECEEDQ
jgi:hypothetical protein